MKLKYIHKIIFNCPVWFCNLVAFQQRWKKSPLRNCNKWSNVVATKQVRDILWLMGRSLLDAQLGAMYHWYSLRWPRPLHSVSCRVCSWKQGTDGFLLQAGLPLQPFSFTEVHGEANIWCLARLLGTTHSLLTPDSWAGHTVRSLYIYLMKWNHVLWSISFFLADVLKG